MDMVNVNVGSGLTPQPPLQRRRGAVLSLIMSTTIVYCFEKKLPEQRKKNRNDSEVDGIILKGMQN